MTTVWKYPIQLVTSQEAGMPEGATPLHVGLDPGGEPCIWMHVDTERPIKPFRLYLVGTGFELPQVAVNHVGSFVHGPFVWHVFTGVSRRFLQ